MISATGVGHKAALIDVGGGASTLVDNPFDAGFDDVTALDIASTALARARARLGDRAKTVTWIEQQFLYAWWQAKA
jgi:ubiquinone/menaquinone biosynthesis C-methylase UbiE